MVCDYEAMVVEARRASREEALARLVARFGEGYACRDVPATADSLRKGSPIFVDAVIEDEAVSLHSMV